MATETTFEIIEHIGVIVQRNDGWTKEVNIVSWNGGPGKIDIRDWDPEHERMGRGITLYLDEGERLGFILRDYYAEKEIQNA